MKKAKSKYDLSNYKRPPTSQEAKEYLAANPSFFREVELAGDRVGHESSDKVRWLLAFVDKDLNRLSQGRSADLRYEILATVFPPKPWRGADWARISALYLWNAMELSRIELAGGTPDRNTPLSGLPVENIQSQLKQNLDDLFSGKGWTIARPSHQETIRLEGVKKIFAGPGTTSAQVQLILVWAFDLIDSKREWLGVCENQKCKRRYVAARRERAKYCSTKCANYVRVTNKRDRDDEARRKAEQDKASGKQPPADEGKEQDSGGPSQATG